MTTEDMDPDDLQLNPDVDQSDPVHKPESMELGAKISIAGVMMGYEISQSANYKMIMTTLH
jgi:hypothetical protein